MKEKYLVIMAAGMGSRFGGLKQIEPMGLNGEFIIDYSIYDAIKYGFNHVVFIIKRENDEVFKNTIGKRIEGKIRVSYVYQDMDDIPEGFSSKDRVKPWGTAHAIYCCRNVVKDNFAIINADDFYGEDAYKVASKYLDNPSTFGMVGYKVSNTLTSNGSVKRGICKEEDGYLTSLVESKVERIDNDIIASPLDNSNPFIVKDDTLVSMNMFLFTPKIFDYLNKDIEEYFNIHKDNLLEGEFLIPDVISKYIKKDNLKVKVLNTNSIWYGVTYKEDATTVKSAIKDMIEEGIYPNKLW